MFTNWSLQVSRFDLMVNISARTKVSNSQPHNNQTPIDHLKCDSLFERKARDAKGHEASPSNWPQQSLLIRSKVNPRRLYMSPGVTKAIKMKEKVDLIALSTCFLHTTVIIAKLRNSHSQTTPVNCLQGFFLTCFIG